MKELIREIIRRYGKLNPSLSDEDFVEMLSSEIADELNIKLKETVENEETSRKK